MSSLQSKLACFIHRVAEWAYRIAVAEGGEDVVVAVMHAKIQNQGRVSGSEL